MNDIELRDYFAGKAMQAILSLGVDYDYTSKPEGLTVKQAIAADAYAVADAMLAERGVRRGLPDADGWIEWGGGDCPVPKGTLVDVKHRDGEVYFNVLAGIPGCAEDWTHEHTNKRDIVRYRMVEGSSK